jgi:oligopeptide transport system permease protein
MKTDALHPSEFTPAIKTTSNQQLSRPSLSYWKDAWRRLQSNKQALVSLYLIAGLFLLTTVGPIFWRQDPAHQSLSEISHGPTWGISALMVEEQLTFSPAIASFTTEFHGSSVEAPKNLRTVGSPHTRGVVLQWDPVPGAEGYAIYRNEIQPSARNDFGLPLAEIKVRGQVNYRDRLSLEPKTYFYTVVPIFLGQESSQFSQIQVRPRVALKPSEARSYDPDATPGTEIRLPAHPFGTDYLGRDLLARVIAGGRVSLSIGFFAPVLYIFLGVLIGGLAGYSGGKTDLLIMRATDLVIALPFLLFMILFRIAFGVGPGESGVFPLIVALVALSWTSVSRLTRGQILQLRESEYVQAARLMGARTGYLLVRHLVPNTLGVILVYLTFAIPSTIFTEAFLSFIGMGVVPPTPSWGSLCNDGIGSFLTHPHEFLFPAGVISITVLAFNLLGDGLRDALDPKMRGRE